MDISIKTTKTILLLRILYIKNYNLKLIKLQCKAQSCISRKKATKILKKVHKLSQKKIT